MSPIDDLIAQHCPNGVEHQELGDVGEFIRGSGLQKKDFRPNGVGCIHYGQVHTHYGLSATETLSFVTPEFAASARMAITGDLVIATTSENDKAVGKAVAWLGDDEVAVSSDACIYRHSLDPKFVSYFFQSSEFQAQKARHLTGTKVRRVSPDRLAKIRIPVPPIAVQHEIVDILDRFSLLEARLEAELEAELEARRLQYEHYRSALLSDFHSAGPIRRLTLGEAFEMKAGKNVAASAISDDEASETPYPCFGGNGIRGFVAQQSHNGDYLLVGRQGALCGNVKRISGSFFATEHAVVLTSESGLNTDWAFHKLTVMNLNQYATKSAQPGLAVRNLKKVPLSVPHLDDQTRIADILDEFGALTGDLAVGLPAEVAARRKQYEYYRDRLLTFDEVAA